MKKLFVLLLLLIEISCLAGCESPTGDGPHALPYRMKFDLWDVGAGYEFQVKVGKPGMYAISLSLYLRDLNEYSHFFDKKETREESAFLMKMMGSKYDPGTREWVSIGIPATFRVRLFRNSDKHQLYDRLITRPWTGGTYMGRYTYLAQQELPPGTYTIRFNYLEGARELFQLKGMIGFHNTAPPK
ncbi:DUF5625 family protein [Herbaspirillum sp. alder98]|uniref:DUF5625 family protein n=1 Tax=Herbaspirillum sp. alder98 TaxID=2913096 RepID=UPI001CD910F2|nr:DUF5625 family protein [Herbaspirillum sp. alder98]MCA1323159.1 DUF5625 family protein [Herbaspirillum sp. alder98]